MVAAPRLQHSGHPGGALRGGDPEGSRRDHGLSSARARGLRARTARRDILRQRRLHPVTLAIDGGQFRSEEHTSELQSLMRISYAVFCLKKKKQTKHKKYMHNSKQHTN